MYAKLTDNQIEFAPINKIEDDGSIIFNYGEDIDKLTQDGFLPYQEEEFPILSKNQTMTFEFIQEDGKITKKYSITEVIPPNPTIDTEQLSN